MRERRGLFVEGEWLPIEEVQFETYFESEDGVSFLTQAECLEHESKNMLFTNNNCLYWSDFDDEDSVIAVTSISQFREILDVEGMSNQNDAIYIGSMELVLVISDLLNDAGICNINVGLGVNIWNPRNIEWININRRLAQLRVGEIK